ncbi:MAG: hypothetical protein JXQ72_14920, partial [Anaerolineae bacterium]|nr:hypothetical protein [Anaerolineae bacterium]
RGRIVADHSMADLLAIYRKENYEITLAGTLPEPVPAWAEGLAVTVENDHTTLGGGITDQGRLHDLLDHLRIDGLVLVAVRRVEPTLEDVFVELTGSAQSEVS